MPVGDNGTYWLVGAINQYDFTAIFSPETGFSVGLAVPYDVWTSYPCVAGVSATQTFFAERQSTIYNWESRTWETVGAIMPFQVNEVRNRVYCLNGKLYC